MPQDGTIWRAPYNTFFKRREDGVVVIYHTADGRPECPRHTFEISMNLTELVAITHFFMGQAGMLAQAVAYSEISEEDKAEALVDLAPGRFINVPLRVGFTGMPDDAVIQPITNITADDIGGAIDIGISNAELKTTEMRDSIDAAIAAIEPGFNPESDDPRLSSGRMLQDKFKDSPSQPPLSLGGNAVNGGADDTSGPS